MTKIVIYLYFILLCAYRLENLGTQDLQRTFVQCKAVELQCDAIRWEQFLRRCRLGQ